MIGRHALGGITIEQGLKGAPSKVASAPRVGNQIQKVAGREEVVHGIAADVRVGGTSVFNVPGMSVVRDSRLTRS